jgi:hypothetical protein
MEQVVTGKGKELAEEDILSADAAPAACTHCDTFFPPFPQILSDLLQIFRCLFHLFFQFFQIVRVVLQSGTSSRSNSGSPTP